MALLFMYVVRVDTFASARISQLFVVKQAEEKILETIAIARFRARIVTFPIDNRGDHLAAS